jgi:hypothetical protein
MAACASLFSLKMITTILEKSKIPFQIQAAQGASAKARVTQVAAGTPSIVALVDSFSELPKELQEYLLSVQSTKVGMTPASRLAAKDRAKGVIIGGKASSLK